MGDNMKKTTYAEKETTRITEEYFHHKKIHRRECNGDKWYVRETIHFEEEGQF